LIPNPFSKQQGERLYKTGDWARHLPDGNLECLGRHDHQIKIRGFRVELGEIQGVLARHPRVRETAVIVREDVSGEKCLVAYIVVHHAHQTTTEELRRFVRQNLPDYMVPAFFVLLDSLPYAPNGKVDLRALPAPDHSRRDGSSTYIAPGSNIEMQIAEIYAQVLRLERIGVTDDFFELGGDSLLAMRAMNRVQELIGRQLPLVLIFEAPTIAQLVEVLKKDDVDDGTWLHDGDQGRRDNRKVTRLRAASASAHRDSIRVLPRMRQSAK
jgi:acyl carrier protein